MTRMMFCPSLRLLSVAGVSLAALGAVACGSSASPGATAGPTPQASNAGAPMLVNCGQGQQPLIRQVAVGGSWVAQVECVTTDATQPAMAMPPDPASAQAYAASAYPLAAPAYAQAPVYAAPAPRDTPAPGYVLAAASAPAPVYRQAPRARPAATRVVYEDDVVEYESPTNKRSWKKSAIIIGSSAGVGAGVGAATGGKKGALIGAAVGGGAATVWDQATRR